MLQDLLSMAQADANLSRPAKNLFAAILAYVDDHGRAILDDAALAAQMGCCQKRLRGYRGELNSAGYCQARRSGAALFVQVPTTGELFLTMRNCHASRGKSATESVALARTDDEAVEIAAVAEVGSSRECHDTRGKSATVRVAVATESVALARSSGWMDGDINLVNLNTLPTHPETRDNSHARACEDSKTDEPGRPDGEPRPARAIRPGRVANARALQPEPAAVADPPGCVRLPTSGRTRTGQELTPEQIRANYDMLTDPEVGIVQHIEVFVTQLCPADVFGLVISWMRAGGGASGDCQYGPGVLVRWLQAQIRNPAARNTRIMLSREELDWPFVRQHAAWGVPAVEWPEEDESMRDQEPEELSDTQLPLAIVEQAGSQAPPAPASPAPTPPEPPPAAMPAGRFVPPEDLAGWLARQPGRLDGADLTIVAPDEAAAGWLLAHRHEVRDAMARLAGRRILAVRVERAAVAP